MSTAVNPHSVGELVFCDTMELVNLPVGGSQRNVPLLGQSAAQIKFGANMRDKLLTQWKPDLPENVYFALVNLADATWWIANQEAESVGDIKWPKRWTNGTTSKPQVGAPPPSVRKAVEAHQQIVNEIDLATFDEFARKVCRSPELSYLTMMALVYRQTKDPKILAKFEEASENVSKHLNGILKILGT